MKQSGSLRVFLATTLVASSIVAMKLVMPSAPLGATVVAAAIGLMLIFSLFRSDARRRREMAMTGASAQAAPLHDGDADSIRRRLEGRPTPQVSPPAHSRDMTGVNTAGMGDYGTPVEADPIFTPPPYGQDGPSYADAPYTRPEAPVLELVQPVEDLPVAATGSFEPILELSEDTDWIDQPFDEEEPFKWGETVSGPVDETVADEMPADNFASDSDAELFDAPVDTTPATDTAPEQRLGLHWGEMSDAEEESEPRHTTGLDWNNFESLSKPSLGKTGPTLVKVEQEAEAEPVAEVCADPIGTARANPVVFAEVFPPRENPGLSFYGGLPVAPAGFAWPRAATEEGDAPLTFVMQWECAKLAAQDATGMLPRSGVLYLFMDLDWSRPMAYRFFHASGPVDGFAPVEMPEDLGPAYGSQAIWAWPMCAGADHDARGIVPRRLPQWAFEPARVDSEADANFWHKDEAMTAALTRMDGEATSQPIAGFNRPFAAFPQDWSAVRMACVYLLDLMRQPEQPAEVTQWLDETRMLYAVASREEPFETIPQASADEMWGWMQMVRPGLEPVFPAIVTSAINATLGARGNAGDLIPAGMVAKITQTHALAPLSAPNRVFGAPSWVQGQIEPFVESEVLLLELSGNETLGHFFGTGVLQFTIAPDDLAAGNFDRVRMTVSAT